MKLTLKNFANVENAEINLNGVTVLTGKADTGKEYITAASERLRSDRSGCCRAAPTCRAADRAARRQE